jgi:hypothetical protein
MRIGECLDYLVNVFTVIDTNRPVLEGFHGVLGSSAHRGIRVRFLDDGCPVRSETRLVSDVIQGDYSALESRLAWVLCTDLVQAGVGLRNRVFYRRLNCFRRLFPIRNRQHSVCLCRGGTKIIDCFYFGCGND